MSTFDGFVKEFPQIRIDYFRTLPGKSPPTACFLSHVHSDHLLGLESLKCPFVYCSPATRELLLRLEKYPHRMNFAKGITESRLQTYRHLNLLLKPIPLETPVRIELSLGNEIQVTLFDANHMVGAVSFLIEGERDAILYTGDARAEPWWVNSLARHPRLVPYTQTPRRHRLSNLYLDTTFAIDSSPYHDFRPKAEGIAELLNKIASFPTHSDFYFHAWTFGYEDVWCALSQALGSQVHLDVYRHGLYSSLSNNCGPGLQCREAAALHGVQIANHWRPGVITKDGHVRLHACEEGTSCPLMDSNTSEQVIHIKPIISRYDGQEMHELGAGGGRRDLNQLHELDITGANMMPLVGRLLDSEDVDQKLKDRVLIYLKCLQEKGQKSVQFDPNHISHNSQSEQIPLKDISRILLRLASEDPKVANRAASDMTGPSCEMPRMITFPYSRHSSYNELRNLVSALQPLDIYPCTAPKVEDFTESHTMTALFGDVLSNDTEYTWDRAMMFEKQLWDKDRVSDLKRKRQNNVDSEDATTVDEGSDSSVDESEYVMVERENAKTADGGGGETKDASKQHPKPHENVVDLGSIDNEQEPEKRDLGANPSLQKRQSVETYTGLENLALPSRPKASEPNPGKRRVSSPFQVRYSSSTTSVNNTHTARFDPYDAALKRGANETDVPQISTTNKRFYKPQYGKHLYHPSNRGHMTHALSPQQATTAPVVTTSSAISAQPYNKTPISLDQRHEARARIERIAHRYEKKCDEMANPRTEASQQQSAKSHVRMDAASRLKARKDAFEAALDGDWGRIRLSSVKGREPSPEL